MIFDVCTGRNPHRQVDDIMISTGSTQVAFFLQFLDHRHQVDRQVAFEKFYNGSKNYLMSGVIENFRFQQVDGIVQTFFVYEKGTDYQPFDIDCVGRQLALRNGKFFCKVSVYQ